MSDLATLNRVSVAFVLRGLLVLCLTLGLIWPKVSAAVVGFLPGVQSYVICTGADMVTILVDAEGNPIEQVATDSAPCLSADVPPVALRAPQFWQQLARDHQDRFIQHENRQPLRSVLQRPAPSRAPPVVV
ncbi:hypothetical protein [Cognatishimia sp. MH4019]|uniref:hypothetical protein n=1 Tax=Cognatishimia sp. MH4019 TaxID=2854030 RepID=UPI001CD474C4|nr:hypothetical protein [Cognatishimia sp. MH4019]